MELLLKDALLMSHDRMWLADTARASGLTPETDPVLTAEKLANSAHIAWATGGALVPADIRAAYENMYL